MVGQGECCPVRPPPAHLRRSVRALAVLDDQDAFWCAHLPPPLALGLTLHLHTTNSVEHRVPDFKLPHWGTTPWPTETTAGIAQSQWVVNPYAEAQICCLECGTHSHAAWPWHLLEPFGSVGSEVGKANA